MMASLGNFEMMASFGNFGTLGEIRNDATHEITKSKNGAKAAFSIYSSPIHKSHNNRHILRWYEWDLFVFVFCEQTPF